MLLLRSGFCQLSVHALEQSFLGFMQLILAGSAGMCFQNSTITALLRSRMHVEWTQRVLTALLVTFAWLFHCYQHYSSVAHGSTGGNPFCELNTFPRLLADRALAAPIFNVEKQVGCRT